MDAVGVGEDDGSLGDEMAVVEVVFGGCVGETLGCDGAVTLDFFDDCADVGQVVFVGELGETVWADYPVEFFVGFFDDVGVCYCGQ